MFGDGVSELTTVENELFNPRAVTQIQKRFARIVEALSWKV
jgi:hypothetical protein